MDQRQWAQQELADLKAEHRQLAARIQALEAILFDETKEPSVPPLNTARTSNAQALGPGATGPASSSRSASGSSSGPGSGPVPSPRLDQQVPTENDWDKVDQALEQAEGKQTPNPVESSPRTLCSDARIIGRISTRVAIGLVPEVVSAMRTHANEDPIVVLRVSDGNIEWHISKTHAQLRALDNELRVNSTATIPQLPARGQWSSCSPVKIDVRLNMLNAYLNHVQAISSSLYPKGQNAYSTFLSTDLVHLEKTRCSFLVSRSRFSGWKARFVVRNGNQLDVLDRPGGSVSLSINLSRAVISAITDNITSSDDEYRNGFTIVEPRSNTNKTTTHYFSAESAEQRQAWMESLNSKAPEVNSRHVIPFRPDQPSIITSASASMVSASPTSPVSRNRSISSRRKSALTVDLSHQYDGVPSSRGGGVIPISSPIGTGSVPSAVAITHHSSGPTSAMAQRRVMSPTFALSPSAMSPIGGRTNVFRVTLGTALGYSSVAIGDAVVPTIVGRCIEFLSYRQAYLEEGLFRVSGTQSQVDSLEVRFERDDVDVDDLLHNKYDVHVVASLLKRYFRLLPEPLIQGVDENYWREVMSKPIESRNAYLRDIVQDLPSTSFDVLSVMTQFLGEVHRNSAINKMTPQNLGIVFSPTLGIPGAVIIALIEHQDAIFG